MATNARTAGKRRQPQSGWLAATLGDAFEHGWGLPLILFAISAIISIGGGWAWYYSAQHAGDLAPLYYFAGGFQLCAQWLANIAMLRARKNRGGVRAGFALLYFIGALLAAGGVFHVAHAAREPGYVAQVEERIRERQPYLQAKADANTTMASAEAEVLAIAQQGRLNSWPASRVEGQSAPALRIQERAQQTIANADRELARLPELPAQRPFDWFDGVMVFFALLTAIVEGIGYFGMIGESKPAAVAAPRAKREEEAPEISKAEVKPERKKPPGIGDVLAIALARQFLGPATAAAMFSLPAPATAGRAAHAETDTFDKRNPAEPTAEVISFDAKREAARTMGKLSGAARRRKAKPAPAVPLASNGAAPVQSAAN